MSWLPPSPISRPGLVPIVVVLCVAAVFAGTSLDSSAASTTEASAPSSPHYYNVDIRAHQFNMCDIACSNAGNPRDLVLWFKNDTSSFGQPWAISLNESCVANVSWLSSQTGMQAIFTTAKYVTACPGSDNRFGNAVLISGSLVSGTNRFWQFPTQEDGACTVSYSQECRRMVCATFGSYAGNVTDCSAHLENDSSVATPQANEYIYIANANYPGGRWLSGDFNLTPAQMPAIYVDQYWRSPQFSTLPAHSPNRQVDYVWHDRAHSAFNSVGSRHCDVNYSDHCYAFAKFG